MSGTQDKNQAISFQGKPRFFNKKKDSDTVPDNNSGFGFRTKNAGDQAQDSGKNRAPYDRNHDDRGGKGSGGHGRGRGGYGGKGSDQNNRSSFSSASQPNNSKMDSQDQCKNPYLYILLGLLQSNHILLLSKNIFGGKVYWVNTGSADFIFANHLNRLRQYFEIII